MDGDEEADGTSSETAGDEEQTAQEEREDVGADEDGHARLRAQSAAAPRWWETTEGEVAEEDTDTDTTEEDRRFEVAGRLDEGEEEVATEDSIDRLATRVVTPTM